MAWKDFVFTIYQSGELRRSWLAEKSRVAGTWNIEHELVRIQYTNPSAYSKMKLFNRVFQALYTRWLSEAGAEGEVRSLKLLTQNRETMSGERAGEQEIIRKLGPLSGDETTFLLDFSKEMLKRHKPPTVRKSKSFDVSAVVDRLGKKKSDLRYDVE